MRPLVHSEGDLRDEEEESYFVDGPPQFPTWGPYVQEMESTPLRQPLTSLNPEAREFNTQRTMQISCDQSATPPELVTSSGVDQNLPNQWIRSL